VLKIFQQASVSEIKSHKLKIGVLRASRRERETRRPESDVTGMTRNAPSCLPLRNRNTLGEIGYDYSHFGEEDPHARLPKPRPDS